MLSSHVSAACSVRFYDTIPAVLARLIKSGKLAVGRLLVEMFGQCQRRLSFG